MQSFNETLVTCVLQKSEPSQEYGFDLHSDRRRGVQYIGAIDADSPAERAGLLSGDVLQEVNGVNVHELSHREVVAAILDQPTMCQLTVVRYSEDNDKAEETKDTVLLRSAIPAEPHDSNIATENPTTLEVVNDVFYSTEDHYGWLRPTWCRLVKKRGSQQYGFNVAAGNGAPPVVGSVDPESIAQEAGLWPGAIVVGVNYVIVGPSTAYKDIVSLITKYPRHVTLLVASDKVYDFYVGNGLSFDFSFSSPIRSESASTIHAASANRPLSAYSANVKPYVCDDKHSVSTVDDSFLHMTASEVRRLISLNRKVDPRHSSISLSEKYRIAMNL